MKEIKIKIPEGYEIDKENSTFEKIVFKEIFQKYPKSIEDVKGRAWYISSGGTLNYAPNFYKYNLSTEKRAKAFLALMQLVELRDAWNQVDEGKDFVYGGCNYVIDFFDDKLQSNVATYSHCVLHFRKEKTRDKFIIEFKELIEEAKELI